MRKKTFKVLCCISLILVAFTLISTLSLANFKVDQPLEEKSVVSLVDFDVLANSYEFREEMNTNHKEVFGENYAEILSRNETSTNMANEIEDMFITQSNEVIYPNYYGGMYIDSNGDLIIQVTEEASNSESLVTDNKYQTYINSVDNSNIDYVEFSYNELEDVNDVIISYFTNNGVNINGFIGNYIDVITNRVVVELENNSMDEQNEFKEKVIDSDLITFVKGTETTSTASYNAGAEFTAVHTKTEGNTQISTYKTCSIGYRARLNGVSGFVTAGHCFGKTGNSASIGTASKVIYNQTMDAAFVTTNSGTSITNNLNIANYLTQRLNTTGAGYLTVGTTVGKVGAISGYQGGMIQALNYSTTTDDGMYHSNLLKASNYNIEGDSGGPVFKVGTTTSPVGTVVGVTSIGYKGGGNLTAFYNADSIASSLGITRY